MLMVGRRFTARTSESNRSVRPSLVGRVPSILIYAITNRSASEA